MVRWTLCGVGLFFCTLPACLVVPIPVTEERVLAGSQVTPEMTAPIDRSAGRDAVRGARRAA